MYDVQKALEFVKVVHEPFIELCDEFFLRKEKLVAKGWSSFLPILNSVYEFSLNEYQISELEKFECELCKQRMGKLVYESSWINDLYTKAEAKYQVSNNYIDRSLTSAEKSIKTLAYQDTEKYEAIRIKVIEQKDFERKKEIARFTKGYFKNYKNDNKKDRLEFYKLVMTDQLDSLGFKLDKTLSTKNAPIVAKNLIDSWKVGFYLHQDNFFQQYTMEKNRGYLDLSFGLIHDSNKGMKSSDRSKYVLFSFEILFPLQMLDFPKAYSEFHNLQELEVLLLAHIEMYSIIHDRFCELSIKGLANAKEKRVGIYR
jgi:hypothetical protein